MKMQIRYFGYEANPKLDALALKVVKILGAEKIAADHVMVQRDNREIIINTKVAEDTVVAALTAAGGVAQKSNLPGGPTAVRLDGFNIVVSVPARVFLA
jgi:hypothetical protein